MTLDTATNLSNIARREKPTNVESAGVTRPRTLVCFPTADEIITNFRCVDYEWYSCLARYDKMFEK